MVLADLVRCESKKGGTCFVRAGPRPQIVFEPNEVVAAIVTCGGLCPGLNDVIAEVVNMLHCMMRIGDGMCRFVDRNGYGGDHKQSFRSYFSIVQITTVWMLSMEFVPAIEVSMILTTCHS